MASPKKPRFVDLEEDQLPAWLRACIGENSVAGFAEAVGLNRTVLHDVLSGRRGLAPEHCQKLAKFGMVGLPRQVYRVREAK